MNSFINLFGVILNIFLIGLCTVWAYGVEWDAGEYDALLMGIVIYLVIDKTSAIFSS